MDNLKILLDKQKIAQIEEEIKNFVHSADGYDNSLKLVFALLSLIRESAALLQTVDSSAFISVITARITEMDEQTGNLKQSYNDHLTQNKEIFSLLCDGSDTEIGEIQNNIATLLSRYDAIIRALVEAKQDLPLETQLKKDK